MEKVGTWVGFRTQLSHYISSRAANLTLIYYIGIIESIYVIVSREIVLSVVTLYYSYQRDCIKCFVDVGEPV